MEITLENMTLEELDELKARIRWVIDNKKYRYERCSCYDTTYGKPHCLGTKEQDPCSCGGDTKKCDFYEYVRNRSN